MQTRRTNGVCLKLVQLVEDLVNVLVQADLARLTTLEVDGAGLGAKMEGIKLILLNFTYIFSE